ncbi:MAG: mannose-1-phosphate guanylyltransferase/mannose-6-phosphate isomerase [Pseudomonadota bacterium]
MTVFPLILSGGSGTRLWPLSRARYPKQFIPLTGDDGSSLLGRTLQRLPRGKGVAAPTLICNQDHRFLVADELERAGLAAREILLEPVARNTAPAITLGALSAIREDPDAVLAVMPSDHRIGSASRFQDLVARAAEEAAARRFVLFGVPPTQPHTGYGYIRCHRDANAPDAALLAVDRFVEKPDRETAERYLASGDYFWNSGIFILHAATFLDEIARLQPVLSEACHAALDGAVPDLCFLRPDAVSFERCPSVSVDYAVMEHTDKAVMMRLDTDWSDVGSWSALWTLGQADADGNVVQGRAIATDTKDTFIHAESTLVATLGISNLVVVDTPDALLVADRDRAQDVGAIVAAIDAGGGTEHAEHRRHHRPWGTFDVLNEGPGFKVKLISVKPGGRLSLQRHRHRSEHWVVVAGTAQVTRGDDVLSVQPNQSIYISAEEWHRLENPGQEDLKIIEVQIGAYLEEDDIERKGDAYNRDASER